MASEVSICNQAISWLGGNSIISLDDATVEAQLCNANYELLRDAVMEEGKWTFATQRSELVQSGTPPVFGYEFAFTIPPDVLSVIMATRHQDNKNSTEDFDWRREGQFILCDAARVWIKSIIRVIDPSRFSAMFNQALASRIAADIAVPLTESTTKEANMWTKYNNAMMGALALDGMQGKSDRIKPNSRIVRNR